MLHLFLSEQMQAQVREQLAVPRWLNCIVSTCLIDLVWRNVP